MSKFQIIVLGIFAFFIAAGLIFFAAFKGGQSSQSVSITIWGTVNQNLMRNFLDTANKAVKDQYTISYVEKRSETMYNDYVEALASGTGPDLLLMSHQDIFKYNGKIISIPYDSYPEANFKTSFIQEGELYLNPSGIVALPFSIDPMVMYWNRDIFTNALVSTPPAAWEQFVNLTPRLTVKNSSTAITQSAIGLGEYRNVSHAKEILSLLMMQAGTSISAYLDHGVNSTLDTPPTAGPSALDFFTQFADPVKNVYTWNRSLQDSKTQFVSNRLAMYLGFASEYSEIKERNPNLNFDVTLVPQPRSQAGSQGIKMTFGNMYGFSIARSSQNSGVALAAIQYLTSASVLPVWVQTSGLPSVRRDALAIDSSQSQSTIFAISALISRGWLDPDNARSGIIFRDMIESVTSGRQDSENAVQQAHNQLRNLFPQQ